jgi:hypothetical protein
MESDIVEDRAYADIRKPPFKLKRVSYIPNPPLFIQRGDQISTLSSPTPPDWDSLTMISYLHKVSVRGRLKTRILKDIVNSGKPPILDKALGGLKPLKQRKKHLESDEWKRFAYSSQFADSRGSTITALWGLRNQKAYIGHQRPHDFQLVFSPRLHMTLWATLDWISEIVKRCSQLYCHGRMYLNEIELPVDIKDKTGELDSVSLDVCRWRSYSKYEMHRPENWEDAPVYDSPRCTPKRSKQYRKRGYYHIEATWSDRALTSRPGYSHLNMYSTLLILISLHSTLGYRYLNYQAMVRSRRLRQHADALWAAFTGFGTRAVVLRIQNLLPAIDGIKPPQNLSRVFSQHPIEPPFKKRIAASILSGLAIAYDRTEDENLRPPSNVESLAAMLKDAAARKALVRRLVHHSVRAAKEAEGRREATKPDCPQVRNALHERPRCPHKPLQADGTPPRS